MLGFSCRRLHTKGFLTLCLVTFARQVHFTDAITFWQRLQRVNDAGFRTFAAAAAASPPSSSTDAANTCTGTSPSDDGTCTTSEVVVATPAELGCCQSCPHLIDAASYARLCPRGGHSHAHGHPVVEAAAATAALSTPYGLPLHLWKILFQIFLTSLNVACWLIPLKNKRLSENKLGMSLANAFSGGVFLSLAFGHLLPECVHGFHDYNEAVPFLLVLAGYLLIFFVEKVAFDAHGALHNMESGGGGGHAGHGHSHGKQCKDTEAHAASSGRSALILLGALAVHSILEMMALGLADTFSDSALLTLSISLHQPAESIALLVAFLKSGLSHAQIITFLSVFSCMGPIGVGLGMLVNEYAAPIVDSIMLAIVAGTFVYVGATEVIPEEWEDSQHKWKKFAALMAGIVSIIGITQYTQTLGGHSH